MDDPSPPARIEEEYLPDLDRVDWRTAATAMATDLHAMLTRHPWLVQAFGSHLLYGPGKARVDDHGLAVFESAGLTGAAADRANAAVLVFVVFVVAAHLANDNEDC